MKQLTMKYIGNDLYIDNKFVGTWANSCGPYGEATGIFAEAKSTCPVTEWAEKNNVELYWYDTLKPVPKHL